MPNPAKSSPRGGVPRSTERRRRPLSVLGEPLPNHLELDLQRGRAARDGRAEENSPAAVAVEALRGLPSYGVDDYVFPSKPTAKWPDPKKTYRWDMGKPFRALVRSLGIEDVRLHDLGHTGPSVLLMQGILGDIVRKITGHRSRELERYQHLSPVFRAQKVDLIAQVLVGDTPTDTPAPGEEQDDANLFKIGGVDGTRTRDLRRDRPAF